MIRVMLVDDHEMFRESMARSLSVETDIEVTGSFGSVGEALEGLVPAQTDLVLLDYDLGVNTGEQALHAIRTAAPNVYVVFLTAGIPDVEVHRVMLGGASGIVSKESSLSAVVGAIRTVAEGRVYFEERHFRLTLLPVAEQHFTEREKSVLKAVVRGVSNRDIAAALRIQEAAVGDVLKGLMDKTGARTRAQLATVALRFLRVK